MNIAVAAAVCQRQDKKKHVISSLSANFSAALHPRNLKDIPYVDLLVTLSKCYQPAPCPSFSGKGSYIGARNYGNSICLCREH
jgi:hypothetical protein